MAGLRDQSNLANVDEQLINDHLSLGELLQQLQQALATSKLEKIHPKLDLFWARLAVHIRAEHLHLFPLVLNSLEIEKPRPTSAPTVQEAEAVIDGLQSDHDFFMSELAVAVKIIRGLRLGSDPSALARALDEVAQKVAQVSRRLLSHNEMEENQIYRWVSMTLTSEEQAELARQINVELKNRPARFSLQVWSNVAE